jgi:hypothetical protein
MKGKKNVPYLVSNDKIMKTFIFVLLTFMIASTNAQVLNSKYDTKNHPKAKGVWATVRYPTGWQVKEGERPNIVQKFSGDYNGLFVMLAIQILDAGAPVEKECKGMGTAEFAEAFSDKENNQFVVNVKKSKHEEKPAFLYEMQSKIERAGLSMQATHKVMTVCYKNTLISAWCSPSKIDYKTKSMTSTQLELDSVSPLCFQFFNSLVLMDTYSTGR